MVPPHRRNALDTWTLDPVLSAAPSSILCGVQLPDADEYDEHRPSAIQMLPESPPRPPSRKLRVKSSGCGATVHFRALPGRELWTGFNVGVNSSIVVPLEDRYFTAGMQSSLEFRWSSCGCQRAGVGCAVCGNPLGSLYTFCEVHARVPHAASSLHGGQHGYLFLPSAVSPTLPIATSRMQTAPRPSTRRHNIEISDPPLWGDASAPELEYVHSDRDPSGEEIHRITDSLIPFHNETDGLTSSLSYILSSTRARGNSVFPAMTW